MEAVAASTVITADSFDLLSTMSLLLVVLTVFEVMAKLVARPAKLQTTRPVEIGRLP